MIGYTWTTLRVALIWGVGVSAFVQTLSTDAQGADTCGFKSGYAVEKTWTVDLSLSSRRLFRPHTMENLYVISAYSPKTVGEKRNSLSGQDWYAFVKEDKDERSLWDSPVYLVYRLSAVSGNLAKSGDLERGVNNQNECRSDFEYIGIREEYSEPLAEQIEKVFIVDLDPKS